MDIEVEKPAVAQSREKIGEILGELERLKVRKILGELEYLTPGEFPRDALQAAIRARDDIIPELLKILEYTIENVEELRSRHDYLAHMYAMFLLAQFREKRAYPLVIEYSRLPGDVLADMFSDFITEDLCRVLACVCGGDLLPIKELVEDAGVNEYVRSAGMEALLVLVAEGDIPREEAMAYYGELLRGRLERDNDFLWSSLVCCAAELWPGELWEDIQKAYDEDQVDPGFVDLESLEMDLKTGKEAVMAKLKSSRFTYIDNTIEEMEHWNVFTAVYDTALDSGFEDGDIEEEYDYEDNHVTETGQIIRTEPKVGRNDPCPCGSGKKYKKCCLGRW